MSLLGRDPCPRRILARHEAFCSALSRGFCAVHRVTKHGREDIERALLLFWEDTGPSARLLGRAIFHKGARAPFLVRGGRHQFPTRLFEGLANHAELGLQDSGQYQ